MRVTVNEKVYFGDVVKYCSNAMIPQIFQPLTLFLICLPRVLSKTTTAKTGIQNINSKFKYALLYSNRHFT